MNARFGFWRQYVTTPPRYALAIWCKVATASRDAPTAEQRLARAGAVRNAALKGAT
jgi:hypothetical protein